jgi:hypothetical protein
LPSIIALEVGRGKRQTSAGIRAALLQHCANFRLAPQIAHRSAHVVTLFQKLQYRVAPNEPRAPGDQHVTH